MDGKENGIFILGILGFKFSLVFGNLIKHKADSYESALREKTLLLYLKTNPTTMRYTTKVSTLNDYFF